VVVNAADEIAPAASVRPFIDAMPEVNVRASLSMQARTASGSSMALPDRAETKSVQSTVK
jgi:hypothetical protein